MKNLTKFEITVMIIGLMCLWLIVAIGIITMPEKEMPSGAIILIIGALVPTGIIIKATGEISYARGKHKSKDEYVDHPVIMTKRNAIIFKAKHGTHELMQCQTPHNNKFCRACDHREVHDRNADCEIYDCECVVKVMHS